MSAPSFLEEILNSAYEVDMMLISVGQGVDFPRGPQV